MATNKNFFCVGVGGRDLTMSMAQIVNDQGLDVELRLSTGMLMTSPKP